MNEKSIVIYYYRYYLIYSRFCQTNLNAMKKNKKDELYKDFPLV